MDIYLVRHAIAESRDRERWPDDALRPLSKEGAELFRLSARGLRRVGVDVDAMLASSYTRAWQTAELLAEDAGWPQPEELAELEPPGSASDCVAAVRRRSESALALVGHEPGLSQLGSLLVTGDEHMASLEFKKGAVVCIRFQRAPAAGEGMLRWSASPKLLRQLGRS